MRSDEALACFLDCGEHFIYVGYKEIKKEESTELGGERGWSRSKAAMWSESWAAVEGSSLGKRQSMSC